MATTGKCRQLKASGVIRWQVCEIVRIIWDDPIWGKVALVRFPALSPRLYVKPWAHVTVDDVGAKYSKGRMA